MSRRRRGQGTIALLAALALLGGCTRFDLERLPYHETHGPWRIAPEQSVIRLRSPLDERVLAVHRKRQSRKLIERAVLENDTVTPRENRVRVTTRWRSQGLPAPPAGRFRSYYTTEIVGETVREEFPGAVELTPMRFDANHRGDFAYILARMPDEVRCIYAWQIVHAYSESRSRPRPFAVDLRYCAPGSEPSELLSLFAAIEIRPWS